MNTVSRVAFEVSVSMVQYVHLVDIWGDCGFSPPAQKSICPFPHDRRMEINRLMDHTVEIETLNIEK